jgi:hypothetical protein
VPAVPGHRVGPFALLPVASKLLALLSIASRAAVALNGERTWNSNAMSLYHRRCPSAMCTANHAKPSRGVSIWAYAPAMCYGVCLPRPSVADTGVVRDAQRRYGSIVERQHVTPCHADHLGALPSFPFHLCKATSTVARHNRPDGITLLHGHASAQRFRLFHSIHSCPRAFRVQNGLNSPVAAAHATPRLGGHLHGCSPPTTTY